MMTIRSAFLAGSLLAVSSLSATADLASNLVGYYSFEADYSNGITTGGLPSGTAVNSPVAPYAGGVVGNAMSMQGADNDHMNLVASFGTGNTLGENFTVSAWYQLNSPITSSTGSSRHFVYEASNNYDISFGLRDLGLGSAGINDGQVYVQPSFFNIADSGVTGWHHVIQTYSAAAGTTTVRSYIDGSQVGDLSVPTSTISGDGINFGAPRNGVNDRGFDGLMDEIAIWDRALSTEELAASYALGLNATALASSDPPSTAPVISSFSVTPTTVLLGESATLSWNVSGATSVTIVDGLNNVAASGSQGVTVNAEKTYTLVAINGNAVETAQVSVSIDGPSDPVGPYVGTIETTEAYLLYSPGQQEFDFRLTVTTEAGATVTTADSVSLADNDYVSKFHVTGLTPATTYRYKIQKLEVGNPTTLFAGDTADHHFTTVSDSRTGQVVKASVVSCANDSTDPVWEEMANHDLDLVILGGDTPYIDTDNLTSIRQKHRHFLQRPFLEALGKNISTVGTWDDHDFGLNNGNGVSAASRKVNTRRGFVEYRAHSQYGTGTEGVYHKVDMGAMEIFMLDPRWFSQTAASPINANESTCFGAAQWTWLLDAIRNSEAPFKVLLQGQVWQDKKNGETDDMHTYWAERDALLDIIKNEKIPGVILVGGDIHVTRYLMHPQRVGYDLHDFVTSPGHTSVIESLNVFHPSVEWSRAEANQFITIEADTTKSVPVLTVRYLDKTGAEHHTVTVPYDKLAPKEGQGLARDLRALWTFDGDLTNKSGLGSRIDAVAENGASLVAGGVRGDALNLQRANSQHVSVARSFLDDNAATFSVSSWCKATSLPAHGSGDRHFILESKVNNHVGLPNASTTGYAISLGLRATGDAQKINLQLYTETLAPQAVGSLQSPGVAPQGGFDWDVDRSLFSNWSHIAFTFDSDKLRLFINGAFVKEHPLGTKAPIAEIAGFVIGGHRAGTGRNFDGMIDEVAVWNRVLDDAEVSSLYNNGDGLAIPTELSLLDTDSDALPDYWETIHGLSIVDAGDAASDLDDDGMDALTEFGFGTLPGISDDPPPFSWMVVDVSGSQYQGFAFQRDTAALDFVDVMVQRSSNLDDWNSDNFVLASSPPNLNGLEQVLNRSSIAVGSLGREFVRIITVKKGAP